MSIFICIKKILSSVSIERLLAPLKQYLLFSLSLPKLSREHFARFLCLQYHLCFPGFFHPTSETRSSRIFCGTFFFVVLDVGGRSIKYINPRKLSFEDENIHIISDCRYSLHEGIWESRNDNILTVKMRWDPSVNACEMVLKNRTTY